MTTGDSVVVGIDGSNAAIEAAQWAVPEAVSRDVPLRFVFAANTTRTRGGPQLTGPDVDFGEEALRAAVAAVHAMDQPVKVETEVVWGPPSNALVEQSRNAALVCVGTVGISAVARAVMSSTATSVVKRAHCPVAVVRPQKKGEHANYVAVGIDDVPDADRLIGLAVDEARHRHAGLVVVAQGCNAFGVNSEERTEARLEPWRRSHPDTNIEVFETEGGLAGFLAKHHTELAKRHPASAGDGATHPLAVLGSEDVGELPNIVGPHDHALLRHAYCSVLVARQPD